MTDRAISILEGIKRHKARSGAPAVMLDAIAERGKVAMHATDLHSQELPEYPRLATGIEGLEDFKGFQGVSIIDGDAATGKSIMALACALELAHEGKCVVYLDAENGPARTQRRIRRWYLPKQWPDTFASIAGRTFFYFNVLHGHELLQIVETIAECVQHDHDGAVVVFDSLNAIGRRLLRKREDELSKVAKMLGWADEVTQRTHGKVAFLALCERTRAGGVKGHTAEYTCTTRIDIARDEAGRKDEVKLTLAKDRDAECPLYLGVFQRQHERGRFVRQGGWSSRAQV